MSDNNNKRPENKRPLNEELPMDVGPRYFKKPSKYADDNYVKSASSSTAPLETKPKAMPEYNWEQYEILEEKIIWPWQLFWKKQSDYTSRAMGVDANMKYDLGKYIYEYNQSAIEKCAELESEANHWKMKYNLLDEECAKKIDIENVNLELKIAELETDFIDSTKANMALVLKLTGTQSKIAELEAEVKALTQIMEEKNRNIAVMDHALFELGVNFDFSKVDEIYERLKKATDDMVKKHF